MPDAGSTSAVVLVERYLRAVAAMDWAVVESCLAPAVVRRGPFADDFDGRAPYLAFLRRTMPSLPGYRMDLGPVHGLGPGEHGARVVAELRESVEIDGVPVVTDEVLLFDVGDRIDAVSIYIRRTS